VGLGGGGLGNLRVEQLWGFGGGGVMGKGGFKC